MEVLTDVWKFLSSNSWIPVVVAAIGYLSTRLGAKLTGKAAFETRLDKKTEGFIETQEERIEDLEKRVERATTAASRWERSARWWFRKAHTLSHALLSARMGARRVLMEAGKPVPETWNEPEDLPGLEEPWAQPAAPAAK